MKTACIVIKDSVNVDLEKTLSHLTYLFNSNNIKINSLSVIDIDSEYEIVNDIKDLAYSYDNLIIISKQDQRVIEGIKKAKNAFIEFNGRYFVPKNGVVLNAENEFHNGFIIDDDKCLISFLCDDEKDLEKTFNGDFIDYLKKKYNLFCERITLKYFGDENILQSTIERAESIYGKKFNKFIDRKYGDTLIRFFFDSVLERRQAIDGISYIISTLKEDIYADSDVSLGSRVFDLLKLKNVKISVAESFTGGRVISEIIRSPGASNFVHEGVVSYSNLSKEKRLLVSRENLFAFGAVSMQVASDMAKGLLMEGNCDIAVATTGLAGPNSDSSNLPVGLTFIAVGTRQGIHVYKTVFSGDREEITETAKNKALFLTIKNLRKL